MVLEQRRYSAAVDADWERAGRFGIRSVPSHIYQKRMLVGFQDYPAFQRLISGT
jgi:predicted DsbA family dithiol-disulfide isomerase